MPAKNPLRDIFTDEHEEFRSAVRNFVEKSVAPHIERWENEKKIDRSIWLEAGAMGLFGTSAPVEVGGGGVDDVRFRVVVQEELARVGANSLNGSFTAHNDLFLSYLIKYGNSEQLERWVPAACAGEKLGALALSESGAGSDLRSIKTHATRNGDGWVLNGSKTFITNGYSADLIVVYARMPSEEERPQFGLFLVEAGMPGFERGRRLPKMGLHAQDTAELFFSDVQLGPEHLIGKEGRGFSYVVQQLVPERLSTASLAVAGARAAVDWTVEYVTQREAFGQRIADFQNTQFVLADANTQVHASEAYLDAAIRALNAGTLTPGEAARLKLFTTEVQVQVIDRCLQLFGGYGYMTEYPIARAYVDARVQTIYGGTSEIMKLIIGRELLA